MFKRTILFFIMFLLVANMGVAGVATVYSMFEDGSVTSHASLERIVSTIGMVGNGTTAEDAPFFAGAVASSSVESVDETEAVRSDSSNEEFIVCDEVDYQKEPAIFADKIIWRHHKINTGGGCTIYAKDLSTNEETVVCETEGYNGHSSIYGDIVVWDDERDYDTNIYMKDLSTGEESVVCDSEGYQGHPVIHKNIVVWEVNGEDDYRDIHMKNIDTGEESIVCDAEEHQTDADIYENIVVWEDRRNGGVEIFMKDLSTGEESIVCDTDSYKESPAIHGNIIVWINGEKSDPYGTASIHGKNLLTDEEFVVCENPARPFSPVVYENIVVWTDFRNGYIGDFNSSDLYMKDLTTNKEYIVCDAEGGQIEADIYGDIVVWADYRFGEPDIYARDISGILEPIEEFTKADFKITETSNGYSSSQGGLSRFLGDIFGAGGDGNYIDSTIEIEVGRNAESIESLEILVDSEAAAYISKKEWRCTLKTIDDGKAVYETRIVYELGPSVVGAIFDALAGSVTGGGTPGLDDIARSSGEVDLTDIFITELEINNEQIVDVDDHQLKEIIGTNGPVIYRDSSFFGRYFGSATTSFCPTKISVTYPNGSEIKDAFYSDPNRDLKFIVLPNEVENYIVLVKGTGDGTHSLGINKAGVQVFLAKDWEIKKGEINYFSVGADGVYRAGCDFDGDDIEDAHMTIDSKVVDGHEKPPYTEPQHPTDPAKEPKSTSGVPAAAIVAIAAGAGVIVLEIGAGLGLIKRRSRIRKLRKLKKAAATQQTTQTLFASAIPTILAPQHAALVPYVQQPLVKYGLPAPMLYAPPAQMQYMPHAPTPYVSQAQMLHYQTIQQPPVLPVYQPQMQPTNKDSEQIAAQAMEYFNSFNQ